MKKTPRLVVELGPYSVQWLEKDPGPCVTCGQTVGSGPIGLKADDPPGPVCDPCMIGFHPGLGMLLLLANITRELADDPPSDPWAMDQRMAVLMAVARLYHSRESGRWPMRAVAILRFMDDNAEQLGQVPLDVLVKMMRGPVQ